MWLIVDMSESKHWSQVPAQIPQDTQCHHTGSRHRHQHDMDTLPLNEQGTVPGGKEQCRSGNGFGRRVPRPLYLHARQAEARAGKVCQAHLKKAVPRRRRVGRDNQPVVTAYKAYSQPLPPSQVQDTRHRHDQPQQHRGTL